MGPQIAGKLALLGQAATPNLRAGSESPQAAARAAREFEEVFLSQAVDEMLKTVDLGSFGGGHAEETWRSFLARAMAEEIAESGTTGIAQSVEQVLTAYGAQPKDEGPTR